ncbi:NADH dehydrogenase [ubiquinone] 1 alpha subcomplex subunit 9, mitochondrial isoform X2 [Folsomia candida]|uniref:NADH dehydrogenase [ubiquinone] 1 alpha subcomplex subunit 9, mitochondrial isoform X2 n=1 Tax=Folsomia candida TaxID=158441 RepID=UPI000B8FD403|nr:NADH dehydrogenase [ubiquinone] 1 alpha subcomplex subunit 9, mitochondrial isoform X2 [Folsomia candida]
MQSVKLVRVLSKPSNVRPAYVAVARLSTTGTRRKDENLPVTDGSINLAGLKRGTGGRSSFNGVVATVFGASGFVGKYVCNRLGKIGTQVIVPYRGDHYDVLRLKLVGDLGQVLFFPFHLRDEDSIRKAMKYSNVVINLIGRDWETMNFKFHDVNVTGARTIARLAKECGVKRLIHFSSLNCDPHPKGVILNGGSEFLKTKYEGELAVKSEFPNATIFRPADIYGQEDRFMRYYAHFWRRTFQWLPLWNRGEKTIKQPVFIGDVAGAVINALRDPDSAGKTYDILGPHRYQLSELADYFFRCMRRDEEWGYRRTDLSGWPIAYLGWDKIERDHVTDTPTLGAPNLQDLGITPDVVEHHAEWELKPYRAASYYAETLGEFEKPSPPKPVVEY